MSPEMRPKSFVTFEKRAPDPRGNGSEHVLVQTLNVLFEIFY